MSSDPERDAIRPERPENPPGAESPRGWPNRGSDYREPEGAPRTSGGGKTVLIVLAMVALGGCCIVGGVGAPLIYYGVRGLNQARTREHVATNYKQIAVAMHNYESEHGTFPAAAMKTRDGRPGLSWRVTILPYLGHEALYRKFKIDEPWDSAVNRKLAAQMPEVFAPRKGDGGEQTHVRLLVGPLAVYDPGRPRPGTLIDISDGTTNTFLFVEAEEPVVWTQPVELAFDPKKPLPALGLPENDYFVAAFCDGSVRAIRKSANAENLKGAVTARGGEVLDTSFK